MKCFYRLIRAWLFRFGNFENDNFKDYVASASPWSGLFVTGSVPNVLIHQNPGDSLRGVRFFLVGGGGEPKSVNLGPVSNRHILRLTIFVAERLPRNYVKRFDPQKRLAQKTLEPSLLLLNKKRYPRSSTVFASVFFRKKYNSDQIKNFTWSKASELNIFCSR